jgi:hypothetical protein
MSGNFTINDTANTLKAIFDKHKNERVFVLGTMCVGKSTLLGLLPEGIDMDSVAFVNITEDESRIISQTPWTNEVGDTVDKIVYRNVKIKPGHPVFGTVIVDCEAVVYLDISDALLAEHCKKRGVDLADALNMKIAIEQDWNDHKNKNDRMFYYVVMAE